MQIRRADDTAARTASLAIWNAVYWTMPASRSDEAEYIAYCLEHEHLLASLEGELVGSGFAAIEPDAAGPQVAKVQLAVVRAARRRGVGTALYRALSAWAAERGKTELEVPVVDVDPDGLEFATKHGFVEVFRETFAALDLAEVPARAVEPPEGLRIVTWEERPELARGMYEVAVEAVPDIPGNEDAILSYEMWLEHFMSGSADRPEATFVALAGDEVVGFAKLHLSDVRPTVAVLDLTGVKRAWRGRGIGRALKATEITWAKRAGYERIETANELRNAAIRHLNESFGFRPIPGRAMLRGPLAG